MLLHACHPLRKAQHAKRPTQSTHQRNPKLRAQSPGREDSPPAHVRLPKRLLYLKVSEPNSTEHRLTPAPLPFQTNTSIASSPTSHLNRLLKSRPNRFEPLLYRVLQHRLLFGSAHLDQWKLHSLYRTESYKTLADSNQH